MCFYEDLGTGFAFSPEVGVETLSYTHQSDPNFEARRILISERLNPVKHLFGLQVGGGPGSRR
jgi:hypothetical protein